MKALYFKEIKSFLSSLIGYVVVLVFLLVTSLFLWVFPEFNILDFGYASLDNLFLISPWILMFLIPAVTMRSFSEEKKSGTIELLLTKPITDFQVVMAKYWANCTLAALAIVPTFLYAFSIYMLAYPVGNIDVASIVGSYLGLLLLACTFVSMGIYSSSMSENQIVSFVIALIICFFFFVAFDSLSFLSLPNQLLIWLQNLGISAHFKQLAKGVIDSRDVLYFASINVLFLRLTLLKIKSRKW